MPQPYWTAFVYSWVSRSRLRCLHGHMSFSVSKLLWPFFFRSCLLSPSCRSAFLSLSNQHPILTHGTVTTFDRYGVRMDASFCSLASVILTYIRCITLCGALMCLYGQVYLSTWVSADRSALTFPKLGLFISFRGRTARTDGGREAQHGRRRWGVCV